MIGWVMAVMLNSFACWLASKLSLWGKSLVLFDNFPFLTSFNPSKKTYINQLGFEKPVPEVSSENSQIIELLEEQKVC